MASNDNIIDLAVERRRRGPRFNGGLMDILEVSRDLVCLCRGGAIAAINGAGVRLLGARGTEGLIGRSLAEFLVPEYGHMLDLFLAGKASEDQPIPTRILALDGTTKEVELQVYRAREVAPDATVVMCREIAAAAVRADGSTPEERRFRQMVDKAMNLVCHVVDGHIRYVNPAGLALLGAAGPEAILGWRLDEVVAGELAADTADPLTLALRRVDGTMVACRVKASRLALPHGNELMVEACVVTPPP